MEVHQGYPGHWCSPSKMSLALEQVFPIIFLSPSKIMGVNKTAINLSAEFQPTSIFLEQMWRD